MTIEMDKAYTTRDGRPVRILCVDGPEGYPVIGIIDGCVEEWTSDGFINLCIDPNGLDLIPVKTKRSGWVNVYRNRFGLFCGEVFDTEHGARSRTKYEPEYIATVQIEWEE